MTYEIRCADVFEGLAAMPERSVHCCVTSPPYWALRDYGTAQWEGGEAGCDHLRQSSISRASSGLDGAKDTQGGAVSFRDICGKCGAKRIDRQLGQESTPQEFVATLVRVFAGVHRVLRDDGVLFVNLGDSYAAGKTGRGDEGRIGVDGFSGGPKSAGFVSQRKPPPGLKPKDRCLVPERFVIAMQEFGWYVRDIIVWHKPAPMPVSVRDRCTPAWEPIYMFAKMPRYFWDAEAVKVASVEPGRNAAFTPRAAIGAGRVPTGNTVEGVGCDYRTKAFANPRNVWRIATEPLKAAHYAAFPSELPTRCIKAATSERGVCSKCLAPWVRVVERKRVATRPGEDSKGYEAAEVAGNRDPQRHCTTTATVDWRPSCQCNAETIPATVLDPFSGAGTTCLAAARLGRHGIGLELNPEYVKLSIERIEQGLAKHAQQTAKTVVRSTPVARSGEAFLYPEFATPE